VGCLFDGGDWQRRCEEYSRVKDAGCRESSKLPSSISRARRVDRATGNKAGVVWEPDRAGLTGRRQVPVAVRLHSGFPRRWKQYGDDPMHSPPFVEQSILIRDWYLQSRRQTTHHIVLLTRFPTSELR